MLQLCYVKETGRKKKRRGPEKGSAQFGKPPRPGKGKKGERGNFICPDGDLERDPGPYENTSIPRTIGRHLILPLSRFKPALRKKGRTKPPADQFLLGSTRTWKQMSPIHCGGAGSNAGCIQIQKKKVKRHKTTDMKDKGKDAKPSQIREKTPSWIVALGRKSLRVDFPGNWGGKEYRCEYKKGQWVAVDEESGQTKMTEDGISSCQIRFPNRPSGRRGRKKG